MMTNGRARRAHGSSGRAWALRLGLCFGLGFGAGVGVAGPAAAETLEGAFLKARYAALNQELSAAARYYREALAFDPNEPKLLLPAFHYSLVVGETDVASALAPRVAAAAPTERLARLMLISDALRRRDGVQAEALLESPIAAQSLLPMSRRVLLGWAAYAQGDRKKAARILNAPAPAAGDGAASASPEQQAGHAKAVASAYSLFGQMHLGLMAAADGDDEQAVEAFFASNAAAEGWTSLLGLEAAGALRRLGRDKEAAQIYDSLLSRNPREPATLAAKASMARGETPEPFAKTPAEGAAAVLYGLGVSLSRDRAEAAITYLQLARHLAPRFDAARFAAAGELYDLEQLELAAETYAGVPPQAALGELARIGRAEALTRAGDYDAARSVLDRLAAEGSERPSVYTTLGAVESLQSRHAACAAAYETALTLLEQPNWRVLLNLGICREQGGDWASAEAAFVEALAVDPEQPDVLNHFGYGLVEQGRRLEEARRMLEIAVQKRPDSGYIVDSLGWALYRLGDFEGAVEHLERAVSLTPSESVIIDHFGDALWRVGRRMEARFQWRRALSFEPTDEERVMIERKLEIGLDRAMAEQETGETTREKKVEADGVETPAAPGPHGG